MSESIEKRRDVAIDTAHELASTRTTTGGIDVLGGSPVVSMNQYAGIYAMLLVAVLGVLAVYLVHRVTTVQVQPVQSAPFVSGHEPRQHALSRFHVRWYPVTLIFLAFDVEMLFMYPWAVVVAAVGAEAVIEMFAFLGVLMVAVVWAWREGALRWV